MKKLKKCNTPWCDNTIWSAGDEYQFCDGCRSYHSTKVLIAQVQHGLPIEQIIRDASIFKSASGMSDYIGISFVTMYNWIQKYFGMNFQEFKRKYICRSESCKMVDIARSSYSRHDYVLKKLRGRCFCACANTMDPNQIMTNAPMSVVREVLRGMPKMEKITDTFYRMVPDPILFGYFPVYSDYAPVYFNA